MRESEQEVRPVYPPRLEDEATQNSMPTPSEVEETSGFKGFPADDNMEENAHNLDHAQEFQLSERGEKIAMKPVDQPKSSDFWKELVTWKLPFRSASVLVSSLLAVYFLSHYNILHFASISLASSIGLGFVTKNALRFLGAGELPLFRVKVDEKAAIEWSQRTVNGLNNFLNSTVNILRNEKPLRSLAAGMILLISSQVFLYMPLWMMIEGFVAGSFILPKVVELYGGDIQAIAGNIEDKGASLINEGINKSDDLMERYVGVRRRSSKRD